MSIRCVVKDCKSVQKNDVDETSGVMFHRFPSDECRKTLWAAALGDVSWQPAEKDVVCSLHFEQCDYILSSDGDLIELTQDAMPSVMIDSGIKGPNLALDSDVIMIETVDETVKIDVPSNASDVHGNVVVQSTGADTPERLIVLKSSNALEGLKWLNIDKSVQEKQIHSKEFLLHQLNKCYLEKMNLKKKFKIIRRKNVRGIQKITKVREKKISDQIIEEMGPEVEIKKKKKDHPTKLIPKNLGEVLSHIEKNDFLSERTIGIMKKLLGKAINDAVPPESKADAEKDLNCSPVMKAFAKTLLFFSSEAYHNVKEVFDLNIPVASVTRTWYNMGLGLPGWSSEAFLMLKDEIQKSEDGSFHSCVIMGECDLFPGTMCDDSEVKGFVDYGTAGDLEQNFVGNLPLAQSALFFLLAPMDSSKKWRIPLAYFLIDTLLPEERANILLECLWRVYNMGSVVNAVVVDAGACSRQTIESLGISFEDLPFPCTSFPHPADGLLNVYVIFDPSHVIDLLRHTWASVAVMVDEKGGAINWKYFTELVKVQETQAGCSEKSDQTATWYWDKTLMRKRLISQVFSSDVANAIDCCCFTIQLPQFSGCESTVLFIHMVNMICDLFRNNIDDSNQEAVCEWKRKISDALNYLFVLRDRSGQGMFATSAKAPFVCLYMNLISLLELYKLTSTAALHHLNQDDMQLLFLAVRSRLNWKQTPSVGEFATAYSLLLQDEGVSLSLILVRMDKNWWVDKLDVAEARRGGRGIAQPTLRKENTPPLPKFLTFYPVLLPRELQRFRASQLVLVHTVKRVAEVLHCGTCILGLQMPYVQDNPTLILLRKTCGGFVYPSQGVIEVCALAEHNFKIELKTASFEQKHEVFSQRNSSLIQKICVAVLQNVVDRCKNPFPHMESHPKDRELYADHLCRLIHAVTASYVLLRVQSSRAWYTDM